MDAMEGTPERRQQLGQWMDEGRRLLRLRWGHVAQRAGMSAQNIRDIRNGNIRITVDAADRIEDALRWERGSIQAAVLHGVKPAPLDAPDSPRMHAPVVSEEAAQMFTAIEAMFKAWGLEMTPEMLRVWHDEVGRQLRLRRASENAPNAESARSDEDG